MGHGRGERLEGIVGSRMILRKSLGKSLERSLEKATQLMRNALSSAHRLEHVEVLACIFTYIFSYLRLP